MKNLTKIFMAVVALFAVACTTDMTGDLAPELGLGEGQQATLTLSLEESRTQLGEKASEVYPLYWSTGDQIAINGTPSAALGEEYDGKVSATFTVEGVTLPYNIVYPASEKEAVTEGCYPVEFPASQKYVEGNIDGKSAPVYGYATTEGEVPTLKHLVGLLQFNVKGEGKVLKSVTVESEKGAIAGTYDVNCESGVLTAQEDSTSNTVSMSFGDGLALGAEATTFYVAVPAGSYGTFVATLATDTEKMTVKFNSDVKPIAAGKVREFTAFTFVHNEGDTNEEFIIDSEDKLIEFARIASTFYPRTVARVTKNLDMSEKDWTPIEGFAYTFDGGSDQGHTITGLKAPLFGTTSAKIKNVKLTNVAISTNDTPIMGALACTITATDTATPKVENCEVSGTLTINNTNLVPSTESAWRIIAYGGIAGSLSGVEVSDVINNVNITYTQVCHTDKLATSYLSIGGIAGDTTGGTHTGVTNNGTLTINGTANVIAVGGCYGYGADNVTGATNNADITLAKVEGTTVTTMFVGGVYGSAEALAKVNYTVKTLTNNGTIKIYKDATGASYVGGVLGRNGHTTDYSVDIDGATNLGNIDINCNYKESFFGGITGRSYGGATVKNVVNGDSKNHDAKTFTISGTCTGEPQIGGCIGDNKSSIISMYNYSKITLNGSANLIYLGGCINYSSGTLDGVYNYGSIEINANTTSGTLNCAGVVRKNTKAISNVENHGDITMNGSYYTSANFGGITYDCDSTITNATNDCTMTFAGSSNGSLYAAGICVTYSAATRENCTNKGEIKVTGTIGNESNTSSDCFIGGFCYRSSGGTETWKNCHNEGAITLTSTASVANSIRVAGFIANCEYANTVMTFEGNCSNSGDITIDGAKSSVHSNGVVNVGGLIAIDSAGTSLTITDTLSNSGVITIKNTSFSSDVRIGGCFGETIHALKDVSNTAAINISNVKFNDTTCISGCIGEINAKVNLENISNTGAITLDEDCTYTELYIAGCLAEDGSTGGVFTNVTNNAPITVKGSASSFVRLGGVLGWIDAGSGHSKLYNYENGDLHLELTECTSTSWIRVGGVAVKLQDTHNTTENHGNITVKGVTGTGGLGVAGIVAYPNNYTRTSCVNNATFTIGAKANNLAVGGITCDGDNASDFVSCSNSGTINVTEDCEVQGYAYIGGITSYVNRAKYVSSSTNSANITFSGKCGLNGAETSILAIGGYAGNAAKFSYMNGFTNSGNITYNGSSGAGVYIGGLFGNCAATSLTDGTQFRGDIINTGNILCSGTYVGEAYAGGIAGNSAISISNAQCFCSIQAKGNMGWITGSARSDSVKATNCKIGGMVYMYDNETEDYTLSTMNSNTFYHHIYGSGADTDWTGTDNHDGCTYLSTKDQIETTPAE